MKSVIFKPVMAPFWLPQVACFGGTVLAIMILGFLFTVIGSEERVQLASSDTFT
ncbi:hypothetical protein D3C72_2590330 [compost metagenome]